MLLKLISLKQLFFPLAKQINIKKKKNVFYAKKKKKKNWLIRLCPQKEKEVRRQEEVMRTGYLEKLLANGEKILIHFSFLKRKLLLNQKRKGSK